MKDTHHREQEAAACMAGLMAGQHYSRERALHVARTAFGLIPPLFLIEKEIRRWYATFSRDVHEADLRKKRSHAAFFMKGLRQWNPVLVGSVLSGAAIQEDLPEILLQGNEKDVELVLLRENIIYEVAGTRRLGSHETVTFYCSLEGKEALVSVSPCITYPHSSSPDDFQHPLEATGKVRLNELNRLLFETNQQD